MKEMTNSCLHCNWLPHLDSVSIRLGTTELTVYIEGDCCTLLATEGPDKDDLA